MLPVAARVATWRTLPLDTVVGRDSMSVFFSGRRRKCLAGMRSSPRKFFPSVVSSVLNTIFLCGCGLKWCWLLPTLEPTELDAFSLCHCCYILVYDSHIIIITGVTRQGLPTFGNLARDTYPLEILMISLDTRHRNM